MALLTYPKFQSPKLDGTNLSGGKVYFYIVGTSTAKDTYSDKELSTENTNPVILDARGEADIFLSGSYKIILKDADDVEIWTEPDHSAQTSSQWIPSVAATYVNATSFTIASDLTAEYEVDRRIKCNDATTLYGSVSSSSYSSPNTTVNVTLDSGSLSASLTSAELSILTATNDSIPNTVVIRNTANTFTDTQTFNGATPIIFEGATENDFETSVAVTEPTADNTMTVPDKSGTLAYLSDVSNIESKLESITATVAANALTVGINPTNLYFRSATLDDGVPVGRAVASAITMVVPDTATLGAVSAQLTRVYELAIDNAGTVEPALVNAAGGVNLNEEGLISTTAISTGADSNNVIYSTTARSNVAYRVVGIVEYTQATAGTYATPPTLKQGMGGNALSAMGSIGYGQKWQSVARTSGTTYYTTGKPIQILFRATTNTTVTVTIGGVSLDSTVTDAGVSTHVGPFIVPENSSYSHTVSVGSVTKFELR